MERLSVASFVASGHDVHVYAYADIGDQLPGAIVEDAGAIFPKRRSVYRDSHGSFSGFANMFRYKLLLERGGWWVDLDMVCLRPFDLVAEYVFATEPDLTITNAVLRVPPGSEVMHYAYARCVDLGRRRKQWGVTGPRLLAEAVGECELGRCAVHHRVFMPFDWPDWEGCLDPTREWQIDPETLSLHLWNKLWAKAGRDKDASYAPGCLYEVLKRRFLGGSGEIEAVQTD